MRSLLFIIGTGALFLFGTAFFQSERGTPGQDTSQVILDDAMFTADSILLEEVHDLGWYYFATQKFDSITWVGREMERLAKKLWAYRQDTLVEQAIIDAPGWIGQGLAYQGYFDKGIPMLEESLAKWEERFGRDISLSQGYVGIGVAYKKMGDFENAIYYYNQAYDIIKQILPETHYYHGNAYSNLGILNHQFGFYDQAIYCHQEAIRYFEKSNSVGVLSQYRFLSDIYLAKHKYNLALEYASKSIELRQRWANKENYNFYIALDYVQLGKIYSERQDQDFPTAKSYILEALNIFKDIENGDQGLSEKTLLELAIIEKKSKNYDQAINYIDQAINIIQNCYGRERLDNIYALLQKADIYDQMGDPQKALAQYQVALHHLNKAIPLEDYLSVPSSDQLPAAPEAIETATGKAIACKNYLLQNPDRVDESAVFASFELAQQLSEKLLTNYTNRAAKARLQKQNHKLYEAAIETAFFLYYKNRDPQYLNRAFQFMEKYKAILLLGALNDRSDANFQGIPAQMLAREKELSKKITLYENLFFKAKSEAEADEDLVLHYEDMLFRSRQSKDSLKKVLAHRYPEYYELKYNLDVATLPEVQRKLQKDEALIEYFAGDSTLFTIAVTPQKTFLYQTPMDSSFQQQIETVRQTVNQTPRAGEGNNFQDFAQNSYALYQKLLEPLAGQMIAPKWIVIPDGLLGYVPFHVLLTAPAEEETDYRNLPYLLHEKTVWQQYSATVMLQQDRKKKRELGYTGFAPVYAGNELLAARGDDSLLINRIYEPIARDGLSSLAYNQAEVEESGQILAGQAFLGSAATESNFKNWAPSSRILHLAMHALTNDEAPMYSQLVFSQDPADSTEDGRLYAYEIYNLELPAELAVLSACNTGNGKLERGEGIMSLSRAFKYAGCPNIVMSLWKADDFTTKELVTDFFRQLHNRRLGKAEALQQARLDFLQNSRAELTHPYYWAGLVYIGENTPLEAPYSQLDVGFGALFLVLLLVFLIWRLVKSARGRNV